MNKTSANPTSSNSPPATRWILVVDDEPSMRQLIEIVLRREGWTVQTAANADEAADIIKKANPPPSLIICDVLMPKVDGLELMRRVSHKIRGRLMVADRPARPPVSRETLRAGAADLGRQPGPRRRHPTRLSAQ
jgi:CheY-like chemotaxis protein